MPSRSQTIVFFHPDLGIGGAERLIIDAAIGLQQFGHHVTIFTSHCDQAHCFDEARDGTLDVRVRGNWLFPATVFGRFKILMTVLRQFHLLVDITLSKELQGISPSVFFVDQLSGNIPLLRWWWRDTKILFYCHFPDLLLVQGRRKWWKRIWRLGFDWLEGVGMRRADKIVVNSNFTKSVVEQLWTGLSGDTGLEIVYPCVDTGKQADIPAGEKYLWKTRYDKKEILSINRFEKKKNIELVVRAYAGLGNDDRKHSRLIVAGGYDNRVEENVKYHKDLVFLAESLGLTTTTTTNIENVHAETDVKYHEDLVFLADSLGLKTATSTNIEHVHAEIDVLFLLSISTDLKARLLNNANLVVYTPSNEHFGIVPLEAMLAGTPVLATNSGGPLETVIDGETGWLRPADDIAQWTQVMHQVLSEIPNKNLAEMGERATRRVKDEFSRTKMASRLDEEIDTMVNTPRLSPYGVGITDFVGGLGIFGAILLIIVAASKVMQ